MRTRPRVAQQRPGLEAGGLGGEPCDRSERQSYRVYNVTLFRRAQRKIHPALIFTNNLSIGQNG